MGRYADILTKDLAIKLLALTAAVGLWLVATSIGSRTVTVRDIPLGVVNMPSDLGVSGELPQVSARLRVPRAFDGEEDYKNMVRAFVDLQGGGLGKRSVPVTVVSSSTKIDVLEVAPKRIEVALDPIVERRLSVRVVPEGNPAEGFKTGEIKVEPKEVVLEGPLGSLKELSSGVEAKVSIEGSKEDFSAQVPLSLPSNIKASPSTVDVSVDIEEAEKTKTVGVRVITSGSVADGYLINTISTSPSSVVIKGKSEAVENISLLETEPVNVNDRSKSFESDTALKIPAEMEIIEGRDRVTVKVQIEALEDTKEVSASVSVVDVPGNLRVESVSPASLRVAVRGRGEEFDSLRGEDVRVVISAAGKNEGTFSVNPSLGDVRTPASTKAVNMEERKIKINLVNNE